MFGLRASTAAATATLASLFPRTVLFCTCSPNNLHSFIPAVTLVVAAAPSPAATNLAVTAYRFRPFCCSPLIASSAIAMLTSTSSSASVAVSSTDSSFSFSSSPSSSYAVVNSTGPIFDAIHDKLTKNLKPDHLQVINESYMHSVPRGSETHFKVIVVADKFEGMPLLDRHRIVNGLLAEEFAIGLHALSISAKTPKQWEGNQKVEKSPPCLGGSKS